MKIKFINITESSQASNSMYFDQNPEPVSDYYSQDISDIAIEALEELDNYDLYFDLSPSNPIDLVLLADVCNWAAKVIDDKFYSYKPMLVVGALESGIDGGYNAISNTYSLYAPEIGVSSYHDPYNEILYTYKKRNPGKEMPKYDKKWSGIKRQSDAFEIALDRMRDGGAFLNFYKKATSNVFNPVIGNRIIKNWYKSLERRNLLKNNIKDY